MRKRRMRHKVILALGLAVLGSGLASVRPAAADLVRNEGAAPATEARAVFELVRMGFENGDQQVLADLVHEDGLRVRSGGADSRDTEYSPSQAYYYFKNLFQSHRTVSFVYLRLEEAAVGERVHALARWVHRRPSRGEDQELRLVVVLSRQGSAWRLVEITTIG